MDARAKTTNVKRKKKRGGVETDGEQSVAYERRVRQVSRVLRAGLAASLPFSEDASSEQPQPAPSPGTPNKGHRPERKRRRGVEPRARATAQDVQSGRRPAGWFVGELLALSEAAASHTNFE
ncbi:hypothetical protein MRX96_019459 [Rhipicephalus microplus]